MKQEIIFWRNRAKWIELMSRKHKKVCTTLKYIKHFPVLASITTGCFSNFVFSSLIGIPIRITSSAIGL